MNNTILTFNFNGYDTFHSHFYEDELNYVLITDDISRKMLSWDIKYPINIQNMSDWEKTLYVRYHPFEFTESDIVAVIDGSMVIGKYANYLIKKFEDSNYDIAIPISHQIYCEERIQRWESQNRINCNESKKLIKFLKDNNSKKYKGCLSGAIRIIRKNEKTIKWLEDTYNQLYQLGENDKPVRLDEVISTITLCVQHPEINCMPLANNIMDGDVFQYTKHKTGTPIHLKKQSKIYFKND